LTWCRFLDIALVCEAKGDLKMAEAAAVKALQVKKDCHGTDFPNYARYSDVLDRVKTKILLQKA
jgi:hypothetical protein